MCLRLFEKTKLVLLLILLSVTEAKSQRYTNWFFGTFGSVCFEPDSFPIPHKTLGSQMISSEASSAITDDKGQLLFYTNGETVYNRFHEVMLNGTGLNGNESAAQGALIVAMPGNDSLYYIFTSDAIENSFAKGYCYSIVNMNEDGGKGEVVSKNVNLQASCTERLTAARHANGIDVWIIGNDPNSNIFRAWLLTCNGIQPAVTSAVGEVMNANVVMNMGYLKISPNGKKLCQTHFIENDVFGVSVHSFFQLFDFDNSTGELSNSQKISLPNSNAFGADFSSDSKLLYLTDPQSQEIDQVECTLPTVLGIEASVIALPCNYGYYTIQLGPDDKIYADKGITYLTVIQNPNIKGSNCLLREKAVNLIVNTRIGLPSVVKQLTESNNDFSFSYVDSCKGVIRFTGQTSLPNAQWVWYFGDGTSSNQQNTVHNFSPANKIYIVTLKIKSPSVCGTISKYKYISPKGIPAKADFSFEGKCDSGFVRFTNTSEYNDSVQFLWSFGDGTYSSEANPIHAYPSSGVYSIRLLLKTSSNCLNDSITKTLNLAQLDIHASPDQTIFEGQTTQLNVTGNGKSFSWYPPTWLSNPDIQNPKVTPEQYITYFVTATDDLGCSDIDSVHIVVKTYDDIYIPSAFTPNDDGLNDTFKPTVGLQFNLVNFSVYNRWGQLVFSTSQKGKGWDGKLNNHLQASDIYVWSIKAVTKQGKKQINKTGTVILIR